MAEVNIVADGRSARIFVDGQEINGIHTSLSDCVVKEADCVEKPES